MSPKCIKISSCACCIIFTGVLFMLTGNIRDSSNQGFETTTSIIFSKPELQCDLCDMSDHEVAMSDLCRDSMSYNPLKLKTSSLESFIRASTAMKDQELRLSGLAVSSILASACQPLADVSKAKIQVNKIALISLANWPEAVCPSVYGLVEHAQNAGYSVVIFFNQLYYNHNHRFDNETQPQDKLMIPVLSLSGCYSSNFYSTAIDDSYLLAADQSNVELAIMQPTRDLTKMQQYLRRLYCWFLLGPVITLAWLSMSGGQQAEGDRVTEETTVELGLNSAADHEETQRNYNQEAEHEETGGETQTLLVVSNGHRTTRTIRRVLIYLRKLLGKPAVSSFGYAIIIVVALPVGISSGGWSFFRFDQNEIQQKSFWDDLIRSNHFYELHRLPMSLRISPAMLFYGFLPLCWSPLQIFCFFLYSRFACKTTWTVPTNFSKLIRSDWFASNVYLLILGVVVPYCSLNMSPFSFAYYTTYNMVCTICNVLFIIILNKHKFVTSYVLFISVCMICAYIESDIVAVFYFMLNSEGSLENLKLTALRTVAIGLTLTLSFSTSTHIIRKLTKPRESLLEGLGEK